MQVVLNETVKNLGYRGDVVKVKDGYFRNYLYPMGLADLGTKSRLRVAESRKQKTVMKQEQVLDNAKEVLAKVKGAVIELSEKANEKGHLYAAVSEKEVAAELKELTQVDIATKYIEMDHFKEVGEYTAIVRLGDLSEKITVKVSAA